MAADDQTIVLGAKDQASKILDQVGDNTQRLGRRVSTMSKQSVKANRKVALSFQSVKAAMGPLLAALAAYKTATAAFRFAGESAEASDAQEEAVRGLTKAIELSGESIGPTMEQHQAFASALQNTANVGDEVTLDLMRQAKMLGVSNDQLQDVTKAAIGLSEATGQGLDESLKKVNESINGNAGALQEYLPQLRNMESEEEKIAAIVAVANDGLAQKADRANTAAGSAERLSNTWGDFQEVIGKSQEGVRIFINEGLVKLIGMIQTRVVPAAMAMREVFRNLPEVWELAGNAAELAMMRISGSVSHAFTEVIPGYASWFAENFDKIWRNAFEASVAVVVNASRQIGDILGRLWDFVSSGFEGGTESLFADIGDIAGKSLLEGFTARTGKLPEIASRQVSDAERALLLKVQQQTEELTGKINAKLEDELGEGGENAGNGMLEGLKSSTKQAAEEVVKNATEKIKGVASDEVESVQQASGTLQATESRLLTRSNTESAVERRIQVQTRLMQNADKQNLRKQDQQLAFLKKIAEKNGIEGALIG